MGIRKLFVALAIFLSIAPVALAPAVVFASPKDAVCEGIQQAGDPGTTGCDSAGGTSIDTLLKLALNILSFVIAVIAVIMIMIGGLKYITSAGEPGKISNAKDTILYSIIGLVIAGFAQIIVRFVLSKAK